jgi:cell division protein FtsL
MAGKVYTVKPGGSFMKETLHPSRESREMLNPTVLKLKVRTEERRKESLREVLIDYIEKGALLLLTVLFLVVSVFFAHKLYQYFMVRVEKNKLSQENVYLNSELTRLTSKEKLEEKAKKLGLRPPTEKDIIRVP